MIWVLLFLTQWTVAGCAREGGRPSIQEDWNARGRARSVNDTNGFLPGALWAKTGTWEKILSPFFFPKRRPWPVCAHTAAIWASFSTRSVGRHRLPAVIPRRDLSPQGGRVAPEYASQHRPDRLLDRPLLLVTPKLAHTVGWLTHGTCLSKSHAVNTPSPDAGGFTPTVDELTD